MIVRRDKRATFPSSPSRCNDLVIFYWRGTELDGCAVSFTPFWLIKGGRIGNERNGVKDSPSREEKKEKRESIPAACALEVIKLNYNTFAKVYTLYFQFAANF